MKTFLAIYLGSPSSRERWNALRGADRKQREKPGAVEIMECLPIPGQ